MKYITGLHALNIRCKLDTGGDIRSARLDWVHPYTRESEDSIFEEYGIEKNKTIPGSEKTFCVANHIRALLDILEEGKFSLAKGMRNYYICNSYYDKEIFGKVLQLRETTHWDAIDRFMEEEYHIRWLIYKQEQKA